MTDHIPTAPDPETEERIREALATAVSDVEAGERLDALVADRRKAHNSGWQPRTKVLTVAAGFLVVLGAVGLVVANRDEGGEPGLPDRVATEPGTTATTGTTPAPGDGPGAVFGTIAGSPLGYRHENMAATVWTGQELLVWGEAGSTAPGSDNQAGAAYDPATDTWRQMARSPLRAVNQHAVWTGTKMVVGPALPADAPELGDGTYHYATYDPATDAWQVLPGSVDGFGGWPIAWTGAEVLLSSSEYGQITLTALDLDTGALRPVPTPPASDPNLTGRPTGGTVFVPMDDGQVAAISSYQSTTPVLSISDPGLTAWTPVPSEEVADSISWTMVWTGEELVSFFPGGAAYSPDTHTWRRLASLPPGVDEPSRPWGNGSTVAAGRHLVSPDGIYDLEANAWTHTDLEVPDRRGDPVLAWTGTEILIWSGSRDCEYVANMCVTPEAELFPADGLTLRLTPED